MAYQLNQFVYVLNDLTVKYYIFLLEYHGKTIHFIKLRKPTEGQLSKWTNLMKGWQFRWFTLDPDSGLLEYYVVRIDDQDLIFYCIVNTLLISHVERIN